MTAFEELPAYVEECALALVAARAADPDGEIPPGRVELGFAVAEARVRDRAATTDGGQA